MIEINFNRHLLVYLFFYYTKYIIKEVQWIK